MYNATLFYGRKGLVLNAISGVDLALWDLLAKVRGEPVHQLLGGAVRDELVFYATGVRPDLAQADGLHRRQDAAASTARPKATKGLARNIEQLAAMRAKVGARLLADARLLDEPRPRLRDAGSPPPPPSTA